MRLAFAGLGFACQVVGSLLANAHGTLAHWAVILAAVAAGASYFMASRPT